MAGVVLFRVTSGIMNCHSHGYTRTVVFGLALVCLARNHLESDKNHYEKCSSNPIFRSGGIGQPANQAG